ncbi:MAG: ABC transporter ATP-binding protein [Pseudomonadota bacterium]
MTGGVGEGLAIRGLSKRFGDVEALREATLDAAPGEVIAVTGPSGAGKTTLCRLIAGLERPDAGHVALAGRDLAAVPAGRRAIAYLFESYALYPHMSVLDNALSPLRAPGRGAGLTGAAMEAGAREVLAMLAIDHLAARLPSELSGGQKQRAALARALVQQDAAITLLDEPISHLDAKLRHRLRGEIKRLLARRTSPTLWSTPDGLEALSVADRVVVLIEGRIAQIGTPAEIWEHPADTGVARLIGDPPVSLVTGRLAAGGFEAAAGGRIALDPAGTARLAAIAGEGPAILGLKPRAIRVAPAPGGAAFEVFAVEPFGKYTLVSVKIGDELVRAKTTDPVTLAAGDPVTLSAVGRDFVVFDAGTGRAVAAPEHEPAPALATAEMT